MSAFGTRSTGNKINVLDKKIPRNPKYEGVQPVVDTGKSLSRYLRKIEEIKQNYRFRKDELFKRMKVTTFIQLMIQVAEINSVEGDAGRDAGDGDISSRPDTASPEKSDHTADTLVVDAENETNGDHLETDRQSSILEISTARSTLEGITRGVGEFDIISKRESPKLVGVDESRPYLLLDVRTPEEYGQCHIITARSFPIAMLSRSVNYETKELLAYRNQPGKIIVLYDEDERIAPKAATTMVERGYDNLFMLSGGMKVAFKYFPQGLLTGVVPVSLSPPKKKNNNNAAPVIDSVHNDFTHNDLYLLNQQLDDALDDKSTATRLSRAATEATRSRVSQMSARSTTSTTSSRPPFR